MKSTIKRIASSVLVFLLLITTLPVNALKITQNTNDITAEIGVNMSDEASTFWDELSNKQSLTKSTNKANYMKEAYSIVKKSDNVNDLKWEDSDTFSFTLDNGVPCIFDYDIRMAELYPDGEGINETTEISYNTKDSVCTNTDSVLFAPYYGADDNFDVNFYSNINNRVANEKGGTARKYVGKNATPEVIRSEFVKGNIATMFFDSHGIAGNNTSYFCVRSSVGIESNDYTKKWAVSLGSGVYGVDGRFMTRNCTIEADVDFCWFAICQGMMTSGICNPLRKSGIDVVYGYSQSVSFDKEYAFSNVFWNSMLSKSTVAEAITAMKKANGNYDNYVDPPAYPIIVSAQDEYPLDPDSVQTVYCTWKLTGPVFTVSYDSNGGINAPESEITGGEYFVSKVVPERFPYIFKGWATNSQSQTADYIPGGTINVTEDVKLYAVWAPCTTIKSNQTYTSKIDFVGQSQYYLFTAEENGLYTFQTDGTVVDTIGQLYDINGNVVTGNDDGGKFYNFKIDYKMNYGDSYYLKIMQGSNTFGSFTLLTSNIPDYTLTYDANGGEGAPAAQNAGENSCISDIIPTKFPMNFAGWATTPDATEAQLLPGDELPFRTDTTVYAVWENAPEVYADSSLFTNCIGKTKLVKFVPEYTGKYKITTNDVNTDVMNEDGIIIAGSVSELFAELNKDCVYYIRLSGSKTLSIDIEKVVYTLTFNSNSGNDAPQPQEFIEGDLLTTEMPDRFQYTFLGWSKDKNATEAQYIPGAIIPAGDATVYAVWQEANIISENSEIKYNAAFEGQVIYTKFIAKTDCKYILNINSGNISIYSESGDLIAVGEKTITAELLSNKVYYIKVTAAKAEEINLSVFTENTGLIGDANNDGVVNTADVVTILRLCAGIIETNEALELYGDYNNDGVVNTADAVAILRYLATK